MTRDGDGDCGVVSRREALIAAGTAGAVSVAGCAGRAVGESTSDISEIPLRAFVTDGDGNDPPFDDETVVYDPGPVSVPLDRVFSDNEFGTGPQGPITDSRMMVTRPPEGYDPDAGYDESWEPMTWGDLTGVSGQVEVGDGAGNGTEVTLDVRNAVSNGLYTVWVVKFASLRNPDEFDAFVTPNGNGLVGFQNLGPKFDSPTETDNVLNPDGDGDATLTRRNEGGDLTGVPGFRPLSEDPVPFVGTADDYAQSDEELGRVADDLNAEDEIHFVGAYHYDNQTWGVYPGPFHLNHFDARFDL